MGRKTKKKALSQTSGRGHGSPPKKEISVVQRGDSGRASKNLAGKLGGKRDPEFEGGFASHQPRFSVWDAT